MISLIMIIIFLVDGCSMLTGDAYSSGHLVPSHLGLVYVQLVEINPFPELIFFPGRFTSNIPRYYLEFAYSNSLIDMKNFNYWYE